MNRLRHSFTLLEVLLVVTLLGLLAGFVLRGVFGNSDSPKQILRRFASVDAEARLVARERGPVELVSKTDSADLSLTEGDIDRRFEFGAEILIVIDQERVDRIQFDRHGQSPGYTVTVEGAQTPVLHVSGQTGWSWIDDE